MSKKTIPFPVTVAGQSQHATETGLQPSLEGQSGVGAEDWVTQTHCLAFPKEISADRFGGFGAPAGITNFLAEDATWLELVNFAVVVPYLSVCYWVFRTSRKWLEHSNSEQPG
jgi:hypothetical protein